MKREEVSTIWQQPEQTLYLKANDDKAKFDNKDNLGNANDKYSGGLVFSRLFLGTRQPSLLEGFALGERALPAAEHTADFLNGSLQHKVFFAV